MKVIKKTLVIAMYSHPENYPPTLNAVEYLSTEYDHIYIVHRNFDAIYDWVYPQNVSLISSGDKVSVRDSERSGVLKKINFALSFGAKLYRTLKLFQPHTILIYDYMTILNLHLCYPFIKKPDILWYHNHDVGDPQYLKVLSLSWLALKSENWCFPKLNIFSLPAIERKEYFPMQKLKGDFFFIPNYPSVKNYRLILGNSKKKNEGSFKLLYQGSIGELHGLEEIIPLLENVIDGRELELVLKGFVKEEYLSGLYEIAKRHNVINKIKYIPPSGYREVVTNTFMCHLGISIHKKNDLMNKTLGTSSNKIYEYAAAGLPTLLYDNAHFRQHLGKYEWAFFTDCSKESLQLCLHDIIKNYEYLSAKAKKDFEDELNFEKSFQPVLNYLREKNE